MGVEQGEEEEEEEEHQQQQQRALGYGALEEDKVPKKERMPEEVPSRTFPPPTLQLDLNLQRPPGRNRQSLPIRAR